MLSTVFLLCAIIGGSIFLIQLFLALIGLDADADVDADLSDSSGFFGILSLRAIVAAVTFFGLGGKIAETMGVEALPSIGIATGAGFAAMVAVGLLMRFLYSLRHEGNIRIKNAVGLSAKVYLRIPPNLAGSGRIQLVQQGRTIDYYAMTASPEELPSGAEVVVVRVINAETVEVASPRARR